MANYTYTPRGVCSRLMSFDIEAGKLHNVRIMGGCPGNLAAIGRLLEGADAAKTAEILRGNDCAGKGTSCADQLAIAITQALENEKKPALQI
ncbi:MAG: TIGR03905 family TSCPD domain-containing protein [Alphaproteobacteria bacterium]|nr:TIGR03905 family TSCPD domain-containing protein [Alphaproteobacteria bacterium]